MNQPPITTPLYSLTAEQCWQLADALLTANLITEQQHATGLIFSVTDDGMAPQLLTGGFVHAVAPDKVECADAIGKVVVITTGPNWYYIGRLKRFDAQVIHAVQDNPAEPSLLLEARPYHALYVVTAIYRPVNPSLE